MNQREKPYQNCAWSQRSSSFEASQHNSSWAMEGRIGHHDGYATIRADGSTLTLLSERQALSPSISFCLLSL